MVIRNNMTELWCADISIDNHNSQQHSLRLILLSLKATLRRPLFSVSSSFVILVVLSFVSCQLSRAWMTGLINNENHTHKRDHFRANNDDDDNNHDDGDGQREREESEAKRKKKLKMKLVKCGVNGHFKCLQIMISLICKCRNGLVRGTLNGGWTNRQTIGTCIPFS